MLAFLHKALIYYKTFEVNCNFLILKLAIFMLQLHHLSTLTVENMIFSDEVLKQIFGEETVQLSFLKKRIKYYGD